MKNKVFLWIAILFFALGVLLTVHAIRITNSSRQSMEKKLATLAQINTLAKENAKNRAAIERFNGLRETRPRPLEEIVSRVIKGNKPEIRILDTSPAAEGWTPRKVSITFDDLPLVDLSRFIENASADTERPPWILTECGITASDSIPGNGHAVLVMEALEKKSGTR